MPKKNIVYKQYRFDNCETCGAYPAIWRWHNGKKECSECATKSFKIYLAGIMAGAGLIAAVILLVI